MLDIPSISGIIAVVGVLVGVTLAYLEVRTLVSQRKTDLVMELYSHFGSKEFQEAYAKVRESGGFKDWNDFVRNCGSEAPGQVLTFFEGIGVLLNRNLIDIGLVDALFDVTTINTWEKTKSVVEWVRKQMNMPTAYEHFEYLYNQIQNREPRPPVYQTQQ